MEESLDKTPTVRELSEEDLPRERALKYGVQTLTDAELLAIILKTGVKGLTVIDLAKKMLYDSGNKLSKLASQPVSFFTKRYKGIGETKAITLLAALQLAVRVKNETPEKRVQIRSALDVYTLMEGKLKSIPHEEFWILLLDQANKVKDTVLISRGGLAATVVDLRIVLNKAVEACVPAIILVHNHPSGNCRPSPQDDNLTKRIKDGAALLDIRVLDHVIVAGHLYYSYNDEGRF